MSSRWTSLMHPKSLLWKFLLHAWQEGKPPPCICSFTFSAEKTALQGSNGNTKHWVRENNKFISLAGFEKDQNMEVNWEFCIVSLLSLDLINNFSLLFYLKKLFHSYFPWPLFYRQNGRRNTGLPLLRLAGDWAGAVGSAIQMHH